MLEHSTHRRRSSLPFIGTLLLTVQPGRGAEDVPGMVFSAEALLGHARRLAGEEFEGRRAGTRGERLAAEYIAARLDEGGIGPPPGKERLQRFPLQSREEARESQNVLGWIDGGDESLRESVIVLGGHLDHLGKEEARLYPGADDNASGVAVILEVAWALKAHRALLGRSVLVAFFGAEEAGLQGSRFFVGRGTIDKSRIALMINISGGRLPISRPSRPSRSSSRWTRTGSGSSARDAILSSRRPSIEPPLARG